MQFAVLNGLARVAERARRGVWGPGPAGRGGEGVGKEEGEWEQE